MVLAAAVGHSVLYLLLVLIAYCDPMIFEPLFLGGLQFPFYCFCLYAHWALYKDMKSGIMTEETYPIEKYSCCCMA